MPAVEGTEIVALLFVIVAVTFVALLSTAGLRSAPGVLMGPWEKAFGWERDTISLAAAIGLFLFGLMGPFAAALRRFRAGRRMSQLDLALTCDVSARHISFLESGRAAPSRAMVLKLAAGLLMPRSATNALLTAAGFAAIYPVTPMDAGVMEPFRAMLAFMMARQGVFRWPESGAVQSALVDECDLPLLESVVDVALVVHGLELTDAPQEMPDEIIIKIEECMLFQYRIRCGIIQIRWLFKPMNIEN